MVARVLVCFSALLLSSAPLSAAVAAGPRVTGFTPSSGSAGTLVKIIGEDLDQVTSVLFRGVETPSLRIVSPVHLKAIVPAGTTTGPIVLIDRDGRRIESRADFVIVPGGAARAQLTLSLPRPNPTPGPVTVDFSLTTRGAVRLAVFDSRARRLRVLVNEELPAGLHAREWDGRDDRGRPVANGIYFVQLVAEGNRLARRIALLR